MTMFKYINKMLFRSVKSSLGRFFAIFAIIALGMGFFTGLRNAEPSMRTTGNDYLESLNMFDLQLISSYGLTDEDVKAFQAAEGVNNAEGSYKLDAVAAVDGGEENAYAVMSVNDKIALPKLVGGKMVENENECLADSRVFTEEDIGSEVKITGGEQIKVETFTIVGLVQSPRYISYDRGTTDVGDGRIKGFLYIDKGAFSSEVYHEILIDLDVEGDFFSDKYEENVEKSSESIENLLKERANERYEGIITDARTEIDSAREKLDEGWEAYYQLIESGTPEAALAGIKKELEEGEAELAAAEEELAAMKEPITYALGLTSNTGYYNYDNDVGIVSGIASIFPAFFILIAALVCLTTMARMVNEERTQIGTLKALGLSEGLITLKYVLYSGIAALVGCLVGFFLGTGIMPQIIWSVYNISYGFSNLEYYFSTILFIAGVAVAIAGSALVTVLTCRSELRSNPAQLIRPKAPGKGKRVVLEKVTPLWKRLSFLSKVVVRNTFRYKGRLAMMLIGIAGCTALLLTGFGLNDSVSDITDYQYEEIHLYDATVRLDAEYKSGIENILISETEDYAFAYMEETYVYNGRLNKQVNLIAIGEEKFGSFFDTHSGSTPVEYPGAGEILLSSKLASETGVSEGGKVRVDLDGINTEFTVSGIFDNYINHYAIISPGSMENYTENAAFYKCDGQSAADAAAVSLRAAEGVSYVSTVSEERSMIDNSMLSMGYIIILIILSAGALAFIVLYNLTNINIMERTREIATVKVLGFNSKETGAYVLRENVILSVIGALIGLVAGIFLHMFVMSFINVDMLAFDIRISVWSYLLSFVITVFFAFVANFFMKFKLDRINMAESLKSVE